MDVLSDPPNSFSNPPDSDTDEESAPPLQYHTAFELYSIRASDVDDLSEILLRSTRIIGLPAESIYKAPQPVPESEPSQKKQKVTQTFLKLLGSKYHLTADPQLLIFSSKSGASVHKVFALDYCWSHDYDTDEVNIIKFRELKQEFTICFEWIVGCVRANFEFSIILAEDGYTQHPIQNLEGCISVKSSYNDATTRTLGLFEKDEDDVISGKPLPLLRSHAAFHPQEDYTVSCSLLFLVDGKQKNITATQTFSSVPKNHCVFTKEALDKVKDFKELHQEGFIGNGYPILQMKVLWLTILIFGD